jgi:CheY-like chemotaxis protein
MSAFPGKTLGTILVVDDQEIILRTVEAILEFADFQVLSANNGAYAIKLAGETEGKIDLVLADVDMPKISGLRVCATLKKARPDMHVMLMSGRPIGDLLARTCGWALIQKPFVAATLIKMVKGIVALQPGSPLFCDTVNCWCGGCSRLCDAGLTTVQPGNTAATHAAHSLRAASTR